MKAVFTSEATRSNVTSVTLLHPAGLQIAITPSKTGFVISPGVPAEIRRWDGLAYEITAMPESWGAEMEQAEQIFLLRKKNV